MKIGIYDPYLDTLGGGEKYMLTAAACLSGKHMVTVFWDDAKTIQEGAKMRFGLDLSEVYFSPNIFSEKISKQERFSHMQQYDRIIYLSDGSIPLSIPKKLLIHFQFPVEWVHTTLYTKLKMSLVGKVICNSIYTKKLIDKKFGIDSVLLYPPVSLGNISAKEIEKKENSILTIGRYNQLPDGSSFKKHELLIDVFKKHIYPKAKSWKLTLVITHKESDTANVKKLEESAKGFPISIVKNITGDELQQLYKKSKIYWHAAGFGENLQEHPERAEHFGIATVEAMSYGAVPVVIGVGGQKEIVQDGVNGFLWYTEDELVEKTLEVIGKTNESIEKNVIERAQLFSQERFCNELNKLLV